MNFSESARGIPRAQGGAFHPNLPNGRASGEVEIGISVIQFKSEKGDFDLPTDGIKIELGGANDEMIFFSHPAHPNITIHTADGSILTHPLLANNAEFAQQRSRIRSRKRMAATVLFGFLSALVLAVISLFLMRDQLVRIAAQAVPADWEIKAGDKLFEQMMSDARLINDPELETQLKQITDPLLAGIKNNRYPFKFHIIEDDTLNAFAMPGGNVVLHTGLLLAADSAEEVAGVLGHEIAHVTQRHSIRTIISSAGLYLILQTVVGDASGVMAVLADNSAFLLNRKFSRDFEREADNHGWDYLIAANIKPDGMITFFQKMEAEEKRQREAGAIDVNPQALEVLSTHPATGERLKHLQSKWDQIEQKQQFRTFDLNYAAFKESLRARLRSSENATHRRKSDLPQTP